MMARNTSPLRSEPCALRRFRRSGGFVFPLLLSKIFIACTINITQSIDIHMSKKSKRVVHHIYSVKPEIRKPSKLPSATIQGEAYTIPELFQRANSGIKINTNEPIYQDNPNHDDIDLEKIKNLDLVERDELAFKAKQTIDQAIQNKELATQNKLQDQKDAQPKKASESGDDTTVSSEEKQ